MQAPAFTYPGPDGFRRARGPRRTARAMAKSALTRRIDNCRKCTPGLAINSLTINASRRNDLPYDTLKELEPVCLIGSATVAFVVHSSLQVASLPEFFRVAKAKPGSISSQALE